ncbi:MAG: ATP phosphoribosyltransferase regulatory subunit, partial [Nitrospinae bacterium]|nr:ATP phosphoribosyltransferase regulatory subunit [Nitrospinota bacterium]
WRSVPQGQGARMELYQAGVELLGVSSPEADAELIALAVEALELLGFDDVALSIGHVGYLAGLLAELSLSPEGAEVVREALMKKDAHGLPLALDAAGAPACPARDALTTLAHRFGGLEQIEKAPAPSAACATAAAELARLAGALERYGVADKVTLDLTEARGLGYYTGVTFEGFVKGIAWPVLSGGRYDRLVGLYGRDLPGAGFAVDTGRIGAWYSEREAFDHWAGADALVVAVGESALDAASLARTLRAEGLAASRDLIVRPLEESLELARRMNIPLVAVTGLPDAPAPGMVKLMDLHTGEERFAAPDELIDLIEPTD